MLSQLIRRFEIQPRAPALWRMTALAWAALTAIAIVFAAQNWITGGPYGRLTWPRNLSVALVQWWTWVLLAPAIFHLTTRYPLGKPNRARWLGWLGCLAVVYLLHLSLVTVIERLLDRITPGEPLSLTFSNLFLKRAGIDLLTLGGLALIGHTGFLHASRRVEPGGPEKEQTELPAEAGLLSIRKGDRTIFVSPRDIVWVEAAGNYTILHSVGGQQHMVRATLREATEWLGAGFAQCSRSALVSIAAVAGTKNATRNGDLTLVLGCGAELRLTRKFRRAVLERLPLIR